MSAVKLLKLKEAYREILRVPLGLSLYREPRVSARLLVEIAGLIQPPLVITVGDFVTENLVREGLEPNVAIVDFRTMREGYSSGILEALARRYNVLRCVNPPGTLAAEAVRTVKQAVKESVIGSRVMVVAEGEEDLLALPAIASAPPRSLVIYGLWLGASVAVMCHPLVKRGVEQFMEKAFEPLS
jgi:uncharacterized protein (UPF0218 family)